MSVPSTPAARPASHAVERPEAGIVVLRLSRPESLNALTDDSVAALAEELDAVTKRGGWANLETSGLGAAMGLENRSQILARSTGALARAARQFKSRGR